MIYFLFKLLVNMLVSLNVINKMLKSVFEEWGISLIRYKVFFNLFFIC